ncbi:hypothetical protein LguiA_026383 [Lonicera macranthoides]
MAESFVFQTAGKILGKLTSLAVHEIGLIWGVKKDFKRLQLTVSAIKAVLLDAAEQKKKNRQVEDWLEKLQDVLYDVDDLLDDFMTEDLRRKLVIKGSKRKAVKNFFSSSNSLALRITMSHKLKNIRNRLEDIDADRKQFELVERAPDSLVAYPLREQTHSFVQASAVIGRDLDKNKIKGHVEGLRSLQYLWIEHCDHLESLLGEMKNFTALRYLSISECPSLTSLPSESMKYLKSLEMLSICQCEKLDLLAEEHTMMELPRGLLSLALQGIPKLKELPRGFENAAATIKCITIMDCPSFEILPEWLQNCASLTKLHLVNCVLLKSVPLGMHQCTALRELRIINCSKNLIEKCKWETGKYWPCISQTPENYLKGLKFKNSH